MLLVELSLSLVAAVVEVPVVVVVAEVAEVAVVVVSLVDPVLLLSLSLPVPVLAVVDELPLLAEVASLIESLADPSSPQPAIMITSAAPSQGAKLSGCCIEDAIARKYR